MTLMASTRLTISILVSSLAIVVACQGETGDAVVPIHSDAVATSDASGIATIQDASGAVLPTVLPSGVATVQDASRAVLPASTVIPSATATPGSPDPEPTPGFQLPPAIPAPTVGLDPNPSVRVIIREIGVTQSHETFGLSADDIHLFIGVEEDGEVVREMALPGAREFYEVQPGQMLSIDTVVYETAEVGGILELHIGAVEEDGNPLPVVAQLGAIFDGGILSSIAAGVLTESLSEKVFTDVGFYYARFTEKTDWGRGRTARVTAGDLILSFDVIVDGRVD